MGRARWRRRPAHNLLSKKEKTLIGDVVQCPWHGSRFCMPDGRALTGPTAVNAPRYDIRVRDGQVEVKRLGEH
jgi:nitrite reductase/ring-hydroxylating ferredoxin subunit